MRALLEESFRAAVAAADPLRILPPHLPQPPRGRTFVAAAGKAAASMALATERTWPKNRDLEGLAITRYRHGLPTRRIRVGEAGLLLALISGGGSSLLPLPAPGVAMSDLKTVTGQLLRSGASIQEINTVRKHLSAILGGRLAAASRARVLALIISDVTGDDPSDIASGPCAPDPTTCDDARAILLRYGIAPPGAFSESPKPGDPAFAKAENRVVATARRSLEAGCEVFRARGIEPVNLGDRITGEAREVAAGMAARVRTTRGPAALISGGERSEERRVG